MSAAPQRRHCVTALKLELQSAVKYVSLLSDHLPLKEKDAGLVPAALKYDKTMVTA